MSSAPIQIFISYAAPDEPLRSELRAHLYSLEHSGGITVWDASQIPLGEDCSRHIDQHLESADIILLLISADYMVPQAFAPRSELNRALSRSHKGSATVIPILLRAYALENTALRDLRPLPQDRKPIRERMDREVAFSDITLQVGRVAAELRAKSANRAAAVEQLRAELGFLRQRCELLSSEKAQLSDQCVSLRTENAALRQRQTAPPTPEPIVVNKGLDLCNVRQAYRSIQTYQRLLFDQLSLIADELRAAGLQFLRWDPIHMQSDTAWQVRQRPAKSTTEFFRANSYWAWDFLPSYGLWLIWESKFQRVHLDIVSDTGYRSLRAEPDPVDFLPAAQSRSVLYVSLYNSDKPHTDWDAAWKQWAADPSIYDGKDHVIFREQTRCIYRCIEADLSLLDTPQALRPLFATQILPWLRQHRPPS